ncbi:hypothetical protein OF83DRAFT_1152129 [Amylostereum chailletii]|nr:hypothetical protein OF83DRAFT_1152129 [Amylostereum chailletii]
MADTFPADESKLVSIFCQTLLYGIFTVLFIMSAWLLWRKSRAGQASRMSRVMMGTAITMFVIATTHIIVNFTRIIKAFVIHKDAPGGPAAYFNELSNFTNIFGSALYIAQTLVGDAFVLYRCAVVWGNNYWIIAFPSLLLGGSTATGIGILYTFAKVTPTDEIFASELSHWITSFFSLTLSTNIIGTVLIAIRIWRINRLSKLVGTATLMPVLLVVVESGAVYSATLIALLATYLAKSWAQYLLLDAISPIVGIVFSVVIVRLGLGLSAPDGTSQTLTEMQVRRSMWPARGASVGEESVLPPIDDAPTKKGAAFTPSTQFTTMRDDSTDRIGKAWLPPV